jgi:hypothetical protein
MQRLYHVAQQHSASQQPRHAYRTRAQGKASWESKTHEAERVSHHERTTSNSLLPELDKTLKPARRSCRRMYRVAHVSCAYRSFTSPFCAKPKSIAEPPPPPMPAVSREIPDSILEHRYCTGLQGREVRSLWIMAGRLLLSSHARSRILFPSLACLTLSPAPQSTAERNSGGQPYATMIVRHFSLDIRLHGGPVSRTPDRTPSTEQTCGTRCCR